eukprot:scaffold455_cov116-Isochrysis_galbana.AAC.8
MLTHSISYATSECVSACHPHAGRLAHQVDSSVARASDIGHVHAERELLAEQVQPLISLHDPAQAISGRALNKVEPIVAGDGQHGAQRIDGHALGAELLGNEAAADRAVKWPNVE